jgi:hypothetical protein
VVVLGLIALCVLFLVALERRLDRDLERSLKERPTAG